MNDLQLRFETRDQGVTLRPYVDGNDLLAEYQNSQGRDPDDLLPPLSSRLFPSGEGHLVIMGVCSCGEAGCGSLSFSIRREAGDVIWEPTPVAHDETLNRAYRFELRAYLDAIDGAAGDPPAGEGAGRRVARMIRLRLGMYDQRYESLAVFHHARIDWVSAWPWTSDTVKVSVTNADGQTVHEFTPQLETEAQFGARVMAELVRLRMPGKQMR
jgi:hypothetical protein